MEVGVVEVGGGDGGRGEGRGGCLGGGRGGEDGGGWVEVGVEFGW